MKSHLVSLCMLFGLASPIPAESPYAVTHIPRVEDATIDGDLAEWKDKAFRIDTFYPKSGTLYPEADFAATAWMAWDGQGLLLGLQVRDDFSVESPASQPWSADSVEIFLAGGESFGQQGQIVLVPGRDAESGAETRPTVHLTDRRGDRALTLVEPLAKVLPAPDGYTMEVRIPIAPFGIKLLPGESLCFNVQFNDRDRREGGDRREWTWFTTGWAGKGPAFMYPLELSEQASGPSDLAAGSSLSPDFRSQRVFIVASPARAGETVDIVQGDHPVLSTVLPSGTAHATAQLILSLPSASNAPPFEVKGGGRLLHRFDAKGVPEKRFAAVRDAAWSFPSVFFSEVLPRPEFEVPGWVHSLTGGYQLETTYYDAAYQEVKTADRPGRYGAVTVLTADGMPPQRFFHSVYRAPGTEKDVKRWEGLSLRVERLPASLGVGDEQLERQAGPVSRFLEWRARDWMTRRGSGAVLLAALEENGDAPMHVGTDPWNRDAAWWLGLKKKLGLFKHRYHIDLPEGYADPARPTEAWPLILFLHGSGERGNDEKPVPKHGPSKWIRDGKPLPFVVVNPQCEKGEGWSAARVMDLLAEIQQTYRIDGDRIYLTGLSMGGYGAWETALAHPEVFAAVAPICGGGTKEEASRLVDLPIWNFHGDADTTVPFWESVDMVEAIRAAGGKAVAFTAYPGVGHDAWSLTYDNPNLYAWFLRNRRGAPAVLPEHVGKTE